MPFLVALPSNSHLEEQFLPTDIRKSNLIPGYNTEQSSFFLHQKTIYGVHSCIAGEEETHSFPNSTGIGWVSGSSMVLVFRLSANCSLDSTKWVAKNSLKKWCCDVFAASVSSLFVRIRFHFNQQWSLKRLASPYRFSDITHNLKWVGIINEAKEEEKNYDQSDPCQARRHSDPCNPEGIE